MDRWTDLPFPTPVDSPNDTNQPIHPHLPTPTRAEIPAEAEYRKVIESIATYGSRPPRTSQT